MFRRRRPAMRKKRKTNTKKYYKKRKTASRYRLYNFKQTQYTTSALQAVASADTVTGYEFGLNVIDPQNLGALKRLYDSYSIRKIVVKIIPKFTEITSSLNNLSPIISATDMDDADVTGLSPNEIAAYQTSKITRGNRVHTRVYRPTVKSDVLAGAPAYSIMKSPWLDLDNDSVPHYGLKVAIPGLPVGATALDYDLQVTLYVCFRGVQ